MSWRLAKSLVTLRDQVNTAYPNRSKASDGTIGDQSHASTSSDHNPNAQGVVCAFDITNDPANGFDAAKFVEIQRSNPHPNLKYMIFKGRIYSRKYGWVSRPNTGHDHHVHVSVGIGSDGKSLPGTYDDITPWIISNEQPVQESVGLTVRVFKAFGGVITTDKNGNGYTEIYHSEGANPVSKQVVLNGNNPAKEGYPTFGSPAFYVSSYDGNRVVVTCVGARPNSSCDFNLSLGWE